MKEPKIIVIGVGSCGGKIAERIYKAGVQSVECVYIDTDTVELQNSVIENKIQLNISLYEGNTEEIQDTNLTNNIKKTLKYYNVVFIIAGFGRKTGTGVAPMIAKIAKKMGMMVVGVATTPFMFEGNSRFEFAHRGASNMEKDTHHLSIVPNDTLLKITGDKIPVRNAIELANEALVQITLNMICVTQRTVFQKHLGFMRRFFKI